MTHTKLLDVVKQVLGLPVLIPGTSEELGKVVDAVIEPTGGRMLGLIVSDSEGREGCIKADDFTISGAMEAVLLTESALDDPLLLKHRFPKGVLARRQLLRASIVTDDGRLIGHLTNIYLLKEGMKTIFRVPQSMFQQYFGSGGFIAGDSAKAYSVSRRRLIVPADIECCQTIAAIVAKLEEGSADSQPKQPATGERLFNKATA